MRFIDKLKSIKFSEIPWRKVAPWAGGVFGVVLFLCLSISTINDTVNKKEAQDGIVTRFPTEMSYFFGLGEAKTGIVLSWYDNTVRLGENEDNIIKLDAQMYRITAADRTLSFSVSDTECAEIDSLGNIKLKKPGNVTITVKNELSGLCADAYLQIIQPVEGFYLKNSSLDLYVSDTGVRIEPIIYPENSTNKAIRWYSKDTSIAEVDQTGHIKPKDTGLVEIVGTTADGGFTAKCFVNVINERIKVQTVNILNKSLTELAIGENRRLIATILPSNARNKTLNWFSTDDSVVSVTKTGVITGQKAGSAVICAKSADGAEDRFTVTVKGDGVAHYNNVITSGKVTYVAYDITLDEMAQKQMPTMPKFHDGTGLKSASLERTRQYLDPNEFSRGVYKYQFMDLSHYNGVSYQSLSKFLEGKGILSGQAGAFIEAAKQYNISELYLVAHACLETGYGTSKLATGVTYNGVRVYNMFGIGAYDSDAVGTGSKMAYNQGWTTPVAAIMGGAEWISKNYINAPSGRQNTIYKMRWNPQNPGNHLYAGDIAWAVSQASILGDFIDNFTDASLNYEVPVYAGSVAPVIETGVPSLSLSGR